MLLFRIKIALLSILFLPNWLVAQLYFPVQGEINALVVLVQFEEDVYEHCAQLSHFSTEGIPQFVEKPYAACQTRNQDGFEIGDLQSWTDNPETEWQAHLPRLSARTRTLPNFASRLVDAPNDMRTNNGSLTDYYDRSSGGKFRLRGEVYPKVYIPQNPQNFYLDSRSEYPNGVVRLSAEILNYIAQNPENLPLQDTQIWDKYQNGRGDIPQPDGIFDLIILVFRFNGFQRVLGGTGISSFGVAYQYNAFQAQNAISIGGLQVHDGFPSGSGVIASGISLKSIQAMIIHEIGHRQFGAYHAHSPFDVMTVGNHQMMGIKNRVDAGWTRLKTHFLKEQKQLTQRIFLKDGEGLRIADEHLQSGDVVVSYHSGKSPWEAPPDGRFADGDGGDSFTPSGLYLHKVNTATHPAELITEWSALPNTGIYHQNASFTFGNRAPIARLAFQEGDLFSPFSKMPDDFPKHPTLDARLAISDIEYTRQGVSFLIHRDYLAKETHRVLSNNYSVLDDSVLRSFQWNGKGVVVFSEGLRLSKRVKISDGMQWIVPEGKSIWTAEGEVWVSSGGAGSWQFIQQYLGL